MDDVLRELDELIRSREGKIPRNPTLLVCFMKAGSYFKETQRKRRNYYCG